MAQSSTDDVREAPSKAEERRAFFLLAVVLGPVLSVLIVVGYGFIVWMSQLIAGPPTG